MEQGKAEKALAAFKRAFDDYPRRFNSLLGAARAARALEDEQAARRFYTELLDVSAETSSRPDLREARTYLGGHVGSKE